eukprot:CAMPEP_0182891172 /NCGR_PEP_ID=MMETSP0034_2-20130328/23101_1 /TAXON_ID=156128 /ORGANISM="Nephroselmis pyriformis, Strain CCMP717" /LENGTH=56 /DNA_ID=CAMNT_0025024767 /DNA_START=33 /DNA_END=200 /DNA_ORIENTATION=-
MLQDQPLIGGRGAGGAAGGGAAAGHRRGMELLHAVAVVVTGVERGEPPRERGGLAQ